MSLTGSLSDLQISIPFSVPSVSEPGLGVRVHACAGCACVTRVWGLGQGQVQPCARVELCPGAGAAAGELQRSTATHAATRAQTHRERGLVVQPALSRVFLH